MVGMNLEWMVGSTLTISISGKHVDSQEEASRYVWQASNFDKALNGVRIFDDKGEMMFVIYVLVFDKQSTEMSDSDETWVPFRLFSTQTTSGSFIVRNNEALGLPSVHSQTFARSRIWCFRSATIQKGWTMRMKILGALRGPRANFEGMGRARPLLNTLYCELCVV